MTRSVIRLKLLFLTLAPSVLLMAVLLGYYSYHEVRLLQQAMLERGITISRYLSAAAEFGVATGNLQQLKIMTSSILDEEIVALRIYDRESRVMLSDGATELLQRSHAEIKGEASLCGEATRLMVFCAPISITPLPVNDFQDTSTSNKVVIGRLEVALSTQTLLQQRDELILRSVAMAMFVLLFALVLTRRVEVQITRPLLGLTSVVERVESGELDASVKENASGELLRLQQGFNSMIDSLSQYRDDMSGKVAEATAKLREAMADLEQKNRDLEVQRIRAEEASKGKSQFLATMSHEIRTPLSGMIGMLSLLENEHDSKRQHEHVQHLLDAASALRKLIDEILDFSRLEAGKLSVMNQSFSPEGIIDDVVMMLAPSAHYKEIDLITDITPELPRMVMGDPLRFRQVLINLAGNAIKFTNEGYVIIRVGLKPGPTLGMAVFLFEVIDTGIGIEHSQQDQVFESFTQLDSGMTKRFSGSGLGTTISRELVHLMGGEIGLESKPGVGSRFWFSLGWETVEPARESQQHLVGKQLLLVEKNPESRHSLAVLFGRLGADVTAVSDRVEALESIRKKNFSNIVLCEDNSDCSQCDFAADLRLMEWSEKVPDLCHITFVNGEHPADIFDQRITKPITMTHLLPYFQERENDGEPGEDTLARIGPLNILLAEDNLLNAKVIMYLLESAGHRVIHVENGSAALKVMQDDDLDAVIMDLRMPGMDGLTATRLRREEEQASGVHLPIIALTANDSKEDRQSCITAGMDDYLVKPVDARQLGTVLHRYCADL